MSDLIEFESGGDQVWIDPDAVTMIAPSGRGTTGIDLSAGRHVIVSGGVTDVARRINALRAGLFVQPDPEEPKKAIFDPDYAPALPIIIAHLKDGGVIEADERTLARVLLGEAEDLFSLMLPTMGKTVLRLKQRPGADVKQEYRK